MVYFIRMILQNPMVWIGVILSVLTMKNNQAKDIFEIFYHLETWRNLFIGTSLYVVLFDLQYTHKQEKVDIIESIFEIFKNMGIILFVWAMSLAMMVNYIEGGKKYSQKLSERYEKRKQMNESDDGGVSGEFKNQIEVMDFEKGKKYMVTPTDNGSIMIEVVEE